MEYKRNILDIKRRHFVVLLIVNVSIGYMFLLKVDAIECLFVVIN